MRIERKNIYGLVILLFLLILISAVSFLSQKEKKSLQPDPWPYHNPDPVIPREFSSLEELRGADSEIHELLIKRMSATTLTQ